VIPVGSSEFVKSPENLKGITIYGTFTHASSEPKLEDCPNMHCRGTLKFSKLIILDNKLIIIDSFDLTKIHFILHFSSSPLRISFCYLLFNFFMVIK
jgi:hypothetical protein